MNKEIQSIIKNLENSLNGQPWFGRNILELLSEVDESKIGIKPNAESHSLIELLWHTNTWAEFVLAHIEARPAEELKKIEENDWRTIDPGKHTWKAGIEQLKTIHQKITELLNQKDDTYLSEMVPNRQFNFRFMLNGLIQHNIYHAGQIAYLNKMLN